MKKIAILFLVTVVLIQCSMKVAIVAYYHINKEYITATLCENKETPKMQCNGKCYLSKKIKAQEEQEQKTPSMLKGLDEIIWFYSELKIACAPVYYSMNVNSSLPYLETSYASPIDNIFQPPQ